MLHIDINSGIFKDFSQKSKDNLITNSTKNYLKVNIEVPEVSSFKQDKSELINSQKESSKLQTQIDTFQNLIKNINSSAGFSEIAKSAISTQSDLLSNLSDKTKELISGGSGDFLKQEISNLIYKVDYLANNSFFNDKNLLTGEFKNQKFIVGMDNQTLNVSLNSTKSEDLGQIKYETTQMIKEGGDISINLESGDKSVKFKNIKIGYNKGEGLGSLANLINEQSFTSGINANYSVVSTGFKAIESGRVENLKINDVSIGSFNVKAKDGDNNLVKTINKFTKTTGIKATVDEGGKLNLTSIDGRGIKIEADSGLSSVTNIHKNEPTEVKFEASNEFTNANISSGFKINGVTINSEDLNITDFIELANSKYDESGVKLEINNGKIKFTSKNIDNMKDMNINLDFKSVNDAYTLGLMGGSSNLNEWRSQDIASGTIIDLNMEDGNTFKINDVEMNMDGKSLNARVAEINSKSFETGVSAEEIDGKVKLTSSDSKMINLYLKDTSNGQNLGLGSNFSTFNDSSEIYMKSSNKITLNTIGSIDGFGISSKDDIDSFVNIIDTKSMVWAGNGDAPDGYISANDLVDKINSKSDLTGVLASFDDTINELKFQTIRDDGSLDSRDFKISEQFANDESGYLINYEDENGGINLSESEEDGVISLNDIVNSYSSDSSSFNYNLEVENVYYEGFENYGKLTLNSNGSNDIKVDVNGSYLFKNASLNSSDTIVNLKNLEKGFTLEEGEALGLFANEDIKSNYDNIEVEELSKKVVSNILKVAKDNLTTLTSNLNTIDNALEGGVNSVKEFVSGLRTQDYELKSSMELTKDVYEKDALIPTIGNNYTYKAKLNLEMKFMKLLLF